MSSIVDVINHYQASINKSLNDTARIVHCIGKLYKLPISVRHLQDTGIGRTVNSLRKYDGEVGIAAKALVTKWKAMVAAEESDDGGAANGGAGARDPDRRHNGDHQERSDMSGEEEDDGGGGGHGRTMAEDNNDEDDDDDDDDDEDDDDNNGGGGGGGLEHRDHMANVSHDSYEESQLRVDEEYRDGPDGNNSDSEADSGSDDQTIHHHHHSHHIQQHEQHQHDEFDRAVTGGSKSSPSQWNEQHHSSASSSSKRHSSGSSRHHQHHHHSSSTSKSSKSDGGGQKHGNKDNRHPASAADGKSHKSSSSSSRGTDLPGSSQKKSSSHGEAERHKERSTSKHHITGASDPGATGSNHSNGSNSSRKDSSHKERRHHRSKEEQGGTSKRHATEETDAGCESPMSASKRSRKEQHEETFPHPPSTSHSSKDKSKGTSSSSSSSSSKRRDRHAKSDSSRERSGETKSSSKSRRKDKSSGTPHASSNNSQEPQENEQSEPEDDVTEGLDCSGGASFADALAMIGVPSGSKKKSSSSGTKEKVKVTTVNKYSPSASTSATVHGSHHPRVRQTADTVAAGSSGRSNGNAVPSASDLLSQSVKLEPLPEASEIVEALPMISPHYRPMPLNQTVMECVFMGQGGQRGQRRPLTEEEALGQSMQSKNLRTKVYSGMKTNAKGVIPTLYELCIRLLQDHLDEIGATGGIPFYILKPVLERANPNQLLHLEHFNPHFVEDSDVLWELHCKRTFRSKLRNEDELETWREMFLRCSEERDAKLKSLTQNIRLSQEQAAAPVRKTQLAYVDSAVKPPRNVISKQAKYGTARAPVVSPAARVAALKAGNVTQAGDARLRVAAGIRDNAQAQVFQPTKPRKAPMMAKVLSSMKGFKTSFRR